MDRRMLIGAGVAQGLEKATSNLVNIMKASYDIKQNQELLNLKKKAIESDIAMEPWLKTKAIAEIESMNAKTKATLKEMEMNERKEKNNIQQGEKFLGMLGNILKKQNTAQQEAGSIDVSDTVSDLGWTYKSDGSFTVNKPARYRDRKELDLGFLGDDQPLSSAGSVSPDIQRKIEQAKAAGYSDEEIRQYLGGQ